MYPNIALVFRAAIRETAVEFGGDDFVDQLTPEIMSVFMGLAQRYPTSINAEVQETTFDSIREGLRTFLSTVFGGDIPMKRNIIIRNPQFIHVELDTLFKNSSATALLNYLGFRLIVSVAAFLPEHMLNLQMLLSIEATGRVLTSNTSWVLCLLAVERVLPTCLVKAYAKVKVESGADLRSRVWLSQLESSFGRNARRLLWMDPLTYEFVLSKMQSHRLYRFFSPMLLATNSCAGSIPKFGDSALVIYHEASKRFQQALLRRLNDGTKFRHPGFVFDTRSRFSAAQRQVYVPLGLVNDSVPTNGTMFAFHLSRVAVRLFGSLVQLVNQYQDEDFTDHSQRTLDELLDCLARDWRALPSSFDLESKDVVSDVDQARYAILTQTAALRLAFVAFQELLHVERIWRVSFRLRPLRDMSSQQLFFLYYALDNCEHSDAPFKAHEYLAQRRLPAELRVNFPLRHMPEFSEAFGCAQGSALRLPHNAVCSVFNLSVPSLH
ncbi:endothelin-converting enzyme 1-like [Ixodes scapularis]